jgi:hypothetical protein
VETRPKNAVGVDSSDQGGGIVLFWHESLEVDVLGMSHCFIDIRVKDVVSNFWNRINFVYGEPQVESRHLMWEALCQLKGVSNPSWLVLGDFNETMWGYEHFSDTPRPLRQMEGFRNTLIVCDLHDIGFSGLPYMWDNGRSGNANVRVCLNRAVADPAWRDVFNEAKVHHLVSPKSDHCLVLVETRKDAWDRREQRVFRYEIMWERVDSLSEEVKKSGARQTIRET